MKTYDLLTIGYEGFNIDEFINRLKENNISRLIDVREIPISRKKGFSKSALWKRLKDESIEYIHMKTLGSPSLLRNKLKIDQDYEYFLEAYSEYLTENVEALDEIGRYIFNGITCIMCFEHSPDKCHRSAIAEMVKEKVTRLDGNGFIIKHI